MKRTAKILSIVLALAVVLGAFAIASSAADVAGVNVTASGNFDGMDPNFKIDANGSNPSGTGYDWTFSGRSGTASIGLSADGEETPNQYLLIENAPKIGSSGPYFGTGYGGKNSATLAHKQARPTVTNGVLNLNGTDIAGWPYFVNDFDIMAPTANWDAHLGLQIRAFLAGDDKLDDALPIGDALKLPMYFKTDEDGTYIIDHTGENKMYVNPYEFTHITVIYESVATEDARSANLYVYVNGEYFFSHNGQDIAGGKGVGGFFASTPNMSYDELRYNWTPSDDTTKAQAFDNIVTRLFDTKYNGNLAEVLKTKTNLDAWESNLYDKDAMPKGKAVAEVEGTVYESLEKAVAATPAGGTLKMLADVGSFVVDKFMTVDLNGFTADVKPAEGFALDFKTEGIVKVVSSVGMTAVVVWDDCYHDVMCEDDFDAMHPLFFDAEIAVNQKLLDTYNPSYFGDIGNAGKMFTLVGWKNVETGELITEDTVVTESDVSAGFILLEPVYKESIRNFVYTQGGVVKESFDGALSLKQVISAADKGTTITLHSDIEYLQSGNNTYIDIGKTLTLDLNGHTLKAYNTDSNKSALFRMSKGTDFTLTSSVAGGKLFHTGWSSNTPKSAGTFTWNNDTAVLRINGNDASGAPTLAVFTGNLVQGYSNAAGYHIDGGMFICKTGGDQQGIIDVRKAGRDGEIKNAIFYIPGHGNGAIGYAGRNTPTDDEGTVTIDNCVILGNLMSRDFVAPQKIVVTNTYITGQINPSPSTYKNMSYGSGDYLNKANTPGTVIIGAGCYMQTEITNANVICADGVNIYEVPTSKEVKYVYNNWLKNSSGVSATSFDVIDVTDSLVFGFMSTDVEPKFVTVIWKDTSGNVIGESEAIAGSKATAPESLKATEVVVPGWLNAVPAEWNESLVVPEGVDEYVITAKSGGKIIPVPSVELYMNVRLTTHFEYRVYVPMLGEGIELTSISFNNVDRMGKYESNYGRYTVNSKKFSMVDGWPGMASGMNSCALVMNFTYEGETYKVTKKVDVISYCDYILNFVPEEGQADYKEKSRIFAANTANYLYRGLALGGKTAPATLEALVNNNTSLIYTMDKENIKEPDFGAISKYVTGIEIAYTDYSPYIQYNLTDAGKAAKISLSCGAHSNSDTEYATLGYIRTNHTAIASLRDVTMTVTPTDGEAVKFVFTIDMYYASLAKNGADQITLDFVEALYAYSAGFANYVNN